ncbi:MAG: ABC transporter substrate-binding protein [bacterium]
MKKKIFLFAIFCWAFPMVWCSADEQTAVAVIFSSDIEPYQQAWRSFKEFLDQKKVALRVSKYNLKEKQPEAICSEINKEKPDLVFTLGSAASKLAKEKIGDIPVLFCMVMDPQAVIGLNITGVSMDIPAMMKLENIKRVLPDVKKIGLIYSFKLTQQYEKILQASEELGFQIIGMEIASGKELHSALKEMSHQIDCFLMIPDPEIYFPQSVKYLLLESLRNKFKVVGLSSFYTKAGALVSFDCDYKDLGRQAGKIALRIFNGEKPNDIKFIIPGKIKVSINLITAERLGIEISQDIIKEAIVFGGEIFE